MNAMAPIIIRGKEFKPEAGSHQPNGTACIIEMAAYLRGEEWSDHPECVDPAIGAFCRTFWDRTPRTWLGLVERLDRIAGSRATPKITKARGYLAADWSVRRFAPRWLRRLGLDDDATGSSQPRPPTNSDMTRSAHASPKPCRGARLRAREWCRIDADRT